MNLDGGIHEIPLPGVTGKMWLCGKHYIAPRPDEVLQTFNADRVICLVHHHELRSHYSDYVSWLRTSDRAVWFPIHDLSSPDFDDVVDLYQSVAEQIRSGDAVIVHCAAGIGRAGTLAVGVCQILGMSLDDALLHVRRHRPGAGPEAGQQMEAVRYLADVLAG